MYLLRSLLFLLLALAAPGRLAADLGDIDAAARGVVRVVIIGNDGDEIYPVSHGTGFAVDPVTIATNAHVVREALGNEGLDIGIVPSGGGTAVYGRIVAISPQNDLALIRLTGDLRLPPLALAGGGGTAASGEVVSVGYPMNVDRAQGLDIADIFSSQPPVQSRGYVSGQRPSRQFDTILHTAPIARGNSGGPLLDPCGRVLGVNSFGADNEGGDAEFFFAVSNSELVPFLRANGVTPQVATAPCRSLAELDAEERRRLEREQADAQARLAARTAETRGQRERAQLEAQMAVLGEREDRLALAMLLLLGAFAAALYGIALRRRATDEDQNAAESTDPDGRPPHPLRKSHMVLASAAFLAVVAVIAYLTRPGLDEIDRRTSAAMRVGEADDGRTVTNAAAAGTQRLVCSLEPQRSRITGAPAERVEFAWTADGCVNDRTQYGLASGDWSRVFVPNGEEAVSVNRFDPDARLYRVERYLLSQADMDAARAARRRYSAPACGADGAAGVLGERQAEVLALLPAQPNERLVYTCEAAG